MSVFITLAVGLHPSREIARPSWLFPFHFLHCLFAPATFHDLMFNHMRIKGIKGLITSHPATT